MSEKTNPNTNCLEGMACPECGSFGPFKISVTQAGIVLVYDDGTEDIDSDGIDWDDNSRCECLCGHVATVGEFCGSPAPEFNEFQKAAAEAYNGGDHACGSPADIHNCGDTLLSFVMIELSTPEGADSKDEAVRRMSAAIDKLTVVLDALQKI